MDNEEQEQAAEVFVGVEWHCASVGGRDEFMAWIEARTNIGSAKRMARLLGQTAAEKLLEAAYEQASARVSLAIDEQAKVRGEA